MKLLTQRTIETNPLVINQLGKTMQGDSYVETRKEGKFYRVYPSNMDDINFIRSLEKYVDVFPPAIGQGDGILVRSSFIDNQSDSKIPVSLKMKCLSEKKATELGYFAATTKINVQTEQKIIMSIQESMKHKDAVWIVTGNQDETGLFVQLGTMRANEKAT